ncbi:MAG: hypothetical protein QF410_10765 [Planctomycetota bacterium]|nr:hypothetical protein [Deltaproteobacteria bacterium]MDP6540014.1 hypothetical protein [Planctomycetota bacterium]
MSGQATQRGRPLAAVALLLLAAACAKPPELDPRYRPTQSVLEVVAVLRRHVADDTYRFPPARDFTGRNVYRASLLRLENLEAAHADALRAGALDDVIAFSKGRALERIRAFDLAAASYRRAAERGGPLELEALRSASVCETLDEAARILPDATSGPPARPEALAIFDQRSALLAALLAEAEGSHYTAVIREEAERATLARARYLADTRRLYPDGDVRALAAMQKLVVDHRESKNTNGHLLSLADLYAELAVEYVQRHPPESLAFDPPHFEELVESAARMYEAVSNQDGRAEKLEAARRLEAFLAFTLKVDRDRFSP